MIDEEENLEKIENFIIKFNFGEKFTNFYFFCEMPKFIENFPFLILKVPEKMKEIEKM